jgi:hypothetical protein
LIRRPKLYPAAARMALLASPVVSEIVAVHAMLLMCSMTGATLRFCFD